MSTQQYVAVIGISALFAAGAAATAAAAATTPYLLQLA